jgi:hypothetical protein
MPIAQSPPPLFRPLSRPEVADFLNDRRVDPECPNCSFPQSEIHLRTDGTVAVVSLPGVDIKENGVASMNPHSASLVIICECMNCGFYRNFSYSKILEWAQQQRGAI